MKILVVTSILVTTMLGFENGECQDGVGVEVQDANLIAGQNLLHERRERRHQSREEEVDEE